MNRLNKKGEAVKPAGPEKKTDTGRAVFGGGGISPDESIKPRTMNLTQRRLLSPTFNFARELVNGRIRGFDSYRVQHDIDFLHELKPDDLQVTDALFKAFKDFAADDPSLKLPEVLLDHNRSFIELELRFNIVTAAYGRVVADRVFITTDDPQVAKAVDVLPKARDLAMGGAHASVQP